MIWFVCGVILFFGAHMLPLVPVLRQGLVAQLGELPYKGLFSIVAIAGLALIVVGYGQMAVETLWFVPIWAWTTNPPLMIVAAILMVAAYMPGNVRRLTRHPMLWAVVIWGVAHLLVTGHLAAVLLFGVFIAYAAVAMVALNVKGAEFQEDPRSWLWDGLNVALGLVLYFLIVRIHAWAGVPVA